MNFENLTNNTLTIGNPTCIIYTFPIILDSSGVKQTIFFKERPNIISCDTVKIDPNNIFQTTYRSDFQIFHNFKKNEIYNLYLVYRGCYLNENKYVDLYLKSNILSIKLP